MKKLLQVSVVVFLLLALSAGITVAFWAADKAEEESNRGAPVVRLVKPDGENPYLTKTYADGSLCNEEFKVITFADPHFKGDIESTGDAVSLTLIENTILQENPDLLVFCGDIAVGPLGAQAARNLGDLLEQHNQYWGYVLGNHDAEDERGPTRAELAAIFEEYEYCVVSSVEGLSGEGNCIVNVKNAYGTIIQSLVFIDSGNYLTEEICAEYEFEYQNGYDFIKYDQIEWYKSEMRAIERENGRMPNSILFIHIPLKEYRTAYNEAMDNETVIYGARRENECDSPYNTGMFDAILEVGSTKAVVCGHDHINDYCVDYKGVKLLYSHSTSYNSYNLRKNPLFIIAYQMGGEAQFNDGHTEFMIDGDGKMTITPIFNQDNPSLFDGLSEEHRKAIFLDETLPPQE